MKKYFFEIVWALSAVILATLIFTFAEFDTNHSLCMEAIAEKNRLTKALMKDILFYKSKSIIPANCYKKGVNDALQTIMLNDLEFSLKDIRLTWGDRADTVRARLNIRD